MIQVLVMLLFIHSSCEVVVTLMFDFDISLFILSKWITVIHFIMELIRIFLLNGTITGKRVSTYESSRN